MKFEGTRKSSQDKDIDVYIISLGLMELKLLRALVHKAIIYTPKVLETTTTCGRLKNFIKEFDKIIKSRKNEKWFYL